MANRHQRRKAAKARQIEKSVNLATAERAMQISNVVKRNLSSPVERSYYDRACPLADMKANIYVGFREPRAGGAMAEKSVQALASRKNVSFGRADFLTGDSAAQAGQRLSGRAILKMQRAEAEAKRKRVLGLSCKP